MDLGDVYNEDGNEAMDCDEEDNNSYRKKALALPGTSLIYHIDFFYEGSSAFCWQRFLPFSLQMHNNLESMYYSYILPALRILCLCNQADYV